MPITISNYRQNKKLRRLKCRKAEKGRKNFKYGYYMLLITATPDVYGHHSDRKISTGLFLPVTKREQDWRTSSDFNSISDQ